MENCDVRGLTRISHDPAPAYSCTSNHGVAANRPRMEALRLTLVCAQKGQLDGQPSQQSCVRWNGYKHRKGLAQRAGSLRGSESDPHHIITAGRTTQ